MTAVLFVVTGADHWTLADGTSHPTGYWAEELATPPAAQRGRVRRHHRHTRRQGAVRRHRRVPGCHPRPPSSTPVATAPWRTSPSTPAPVACSLPRWTPASRSRCCATPRRPCSPPGARTAAGRLPGRGPVQRARRGGPHSAHRSEPRLLGAARPEPHRHPEPPLIPRRCPPSALPHLWGNHERPRARQAAGPVRVHRLRHRPGAARRRNLLRRPRVRPAAGPSHRLRPAVRGRRGERHGQLPRPLLHRDLQPPQGRPRQAPLRMSRLPKRA